jgi:DNA-binding CsgD family transcriptional regulator
MPGGPISEITETGLVLADLCLKGVLLDSGAATILQYFNGPGKAAQCIPAELAEVIREFKSSDKKRAPTVRHFRLRNTQYICRAFLIEPDYRWFAQPVVALYIEKNTLVIEAVESISADYQLTIREREALEGLLAGLSSKDLAKQMKISPNTVKAFLRLIMIKMGVSSRAELFARVLSKTKQQGTVD